MQRVALVGTIKPGKEADLWRTQEQLSAASGKADAAFETYIGSGYFLLLIDAPVADFQNRFRDMVNSGPLQSVMQAIHSCVDGFPSGQYATGDQQRQGNGNSFSSADLPMATLAAQYTPGQGIQTFTEQNNGGNGARQQTQSAGASQRRGG